MIMDSGNSQPLSHPRKVGKEMDMPNILIVPRHKGGINVPEGVGLRDAIKLYNQGYGRALGRAMTVARHHHPELEQVLRDTLLELRDVSKIHIVKKKR